MKKHLFVAAIASAGVIGLSAVTSAQNRDYRDGRDYDYRSHSHQDLQRKINHLNRMLAHVQWEMRSYGAGRHIWSEYRHLSREIDHVNYEFNRGYVDRYHLEREIEHIHGELHHIELELRIRDRDYYRWY